MKPFRSAGAVLVIGFTLLSVAGCAGGGGADVGNPLVGTVYREKGVPASNSMIILSKRATDPIGVTHAPPVNRDGEISFTVRPVFFDTTYSGVDGSFRFDTVYPGSYALVANYLDLRAILYIEQVPWQIGEAQLYLETPATIRVRSYGHDSLPVSVQAIGIFGTGCYQKVDQNRELLLMNVPAGERLDLVLYLEDSSRMSFPGFKIDPGCNAELHIDPKLPATHWTPHTCGYRDPADRPYIMETYIPSIAGDGIDSSAEERFFDIRISFSHPMDAVSCADALETYSSDGSASIGSLWWAGGNTLYISLCISRESEDCIEEPGRFADGITYGVTLDTTACSAFGVPFAHSAEIRFTPVEE